MANAVRGQVGVRVGGRDLLLEYTIDAYCQLEARLNQPATEIVARLGTDDRLSFVRAVLWAGLLEHQRTAAGAPEFDEKAAGELIRQPGGPSLTLKIKQALDESFPEPEEPAADGAANPPPTTAVAAGPGAAS